MLDVIESSASQEEAEERGPYYPYRDSETKAIADEGRRLKFGLFQTETQAIIGLLILGRADIAQKFEEAALTAHTADAPLTLDTYDINRPYGDWCTALMEHYRRNDFTRGFEPMDIVEALTARGLWGVGRPTGPRRGESERLNWPQANYYTQTACELSNQFDDGKADAWMLLTVHLIAEANGCAYRRETLLIPSGDDSEESEDEER